MSAHLHSVTKANRTRVLRRLVAALDAAFVAMRVAVAQSAGASVLHARIHFTSAATTVADALLACVGLLRAAFHNTKTLHHKPTVLQAKAAATRVGVAVFSLALLLAAVAHTQFTRVHLVRAVLHAALSAVLVERALGGAVHGEVVAVVEAALLGLAVGVLCDRAGSAWAGRWGRRIRRRVGWSWRCGCWRCGFDTHGRQTEMDLILVG